MRLTAMSNSDRAEAISAFNARYGEMDRALWCLSTHSRPALLAGHSSPVVETLVWTVRSWWGVQGVRTETKTLMAEALASLEWSRELFEETTQVPPGADADAYQLVFTLVKRSSDLGVPRREFSLTSKVLHWLLPWRVPVYDSFVRQSLGIPTGWDHPEAYRRVAKQVFAAARAVTAEDPSWVGTLTPRSPLRAFDKCLWWIGGGSAGSAAAVRDPWKIPRQLGLECLD